ncbi:MAG: hypothetical protein NVSMB13_05920 [Mycobacteriales bacterium]
MRANAVVRLLAVAVLCVGWLLPNGAAGAATMPLTITAAPSHAAPGGQVRLYVHTNTEPAADLASLRLCSVPLPFSLDGPAAQGGATESDEGVGSAASPLVTATVPESARPTTGEITSNYWFWLASADGQCTVSSPLGQQSNRVIVRVDAPAVVAPVVVAPVVVAPQTGVVPETRVLAQRFTRPEVLSAPPGAAVTAVPVAVSAAPPAEAVRRTAGFTG